MSLEKPIFKDQLSKESINFEDFWGEIESDVKEEINTIYNESIKKLTRVIDNNTMEKNVEKLMINEKVFLEKIIAKLQEAEKTNTKEIILLFDIDETIARTKFSSGEISGSIIRPVFTKLMEKIFPKIESGKIKVGFITTRGDGDENGETLKRQLKEENQLSLIAKYIDENYLFSTAKNAEFESPFHNQNIEEFKKMYGQIIELKTDDDFYNLTTTGTLKKLDIINAIESKKPEDSSLIIIDDDRNGYPEYLIENKKLFGISLAGINEGSFYV